MTDFKTILDTYNQYSKDITNESQTKQYLVTPILTLLEYNVNSPASVVTEFTADVAGRNNEKLDYVLKKDHKVVILIEAKPHTSKLDFKEREQLERYFNCREQVHQARFAILTNGIVWKFYSDSVKLGVLDKDPFFTFDLRNPDTYQKMMDFSAVRFDADKMCEHAKMRNIVESINQHFFNKLFMFNENSSIEEARLLMNLVSECNVDFGGRLTDNKVKELYTPFIEARDTFMKNYIVSKMTSPAKESEIKEEKPQITENEYRLLDIIRSMLCEYTDIEKIVIRNRTGLGNSSILFEDNQRKPILGISCNENSILINISGNNHKLEKISDIYKHKSEILKELSNYISIKD